MLRIDDKRDKVAAVELPEVFPGGAAIVGGPQVLSGQPIECSTIGRENEPGG